MWKKRIIGGLTLIIVLYILFQIGYVATSGPSFCAKCHQIEEYVTSWETSNHKKINCLYCHQTKGELGKIQAKARGLNYVIQHFGRDYTIPTRALIDTQNCLICHLGDSKRYPDTVPLKNTSKVNHYKTIKESQSCLECHRDAGHKTDIYLTRDLKGFKS